MSIKHDMGEYFLNQMMLVSLTSNTTNVTYRAGADNISEALEFTPDFSGFSVLCFVCRCLSFGLRILITPLVSSNLFSFILSNHAITHKTSDV
jgi:hypothetical protein